MTRSKSMRTRTIRLCACATVVFSATALSAYGPVLPPAAAPGAGFGTLLTDRTLGLSGGILSALSTPCQVRVNVPPGTFAVPLQLKLTAPNLRRVQSLLDAGRFEAYQALCGVGIEARRDDGTEIRGRLAKKKVALTFAFVAGNRAKTVLRWNSARGEYVRIGKAPASAGSLTLLVQRVGTFVVVSPKR